MKTKKDKFEPVGAERMTDAELSKQLGSYQRTESVGMLLGVLLVIAGCIMMFVYRNIAVICILVFAGVALFLLVAKPAQTKKKALRPGAGAGHAAHRLGVPEGGEAVGGRLYRVYRDGLPRGRA
jgi:hypothetical protein